ncbi:GGDEF domain-containing protein [Gammaproteobacteria bacterium AH-315-C21]|nr:GGDEF domain-containing protein [Gammaproteobacteria bacterium AH-315-C21]
MPLQQLIDDAMRQVTADKSLFDQHSEQSGKTEDKALAALFRISGALQTSLDIHLVIQAFYDGLIDMFGTSTLEYSHEDSKLKLAHGILGRHRCNYQLTLHGKTLGEVTISRRKRFTKAEILLLENLLCTLVNPLNNALLYQEALAAALRDPLTNLNNRRAMEATLIRETELAKRNRTLLSLITLDIDFFKKINDTYGHLTGDKVIVEVANALQNAVRSCDIVFRYGGEEFVVILSGTNTHGAHLLAERIRKTIEAQLIPHEDGDINISASLGVATFEHADDKHSLFSKADAALYQAKRMGRNRTEIYSDETTSANTAAPVESPKKGLTRNEITSKVSFAEATP